MAETNGSNAVSITAKFSFPSDVSSEVQQTFDATNCEPAMLGLPAGVEPVKVSDGM